MSNDKKIISYGVMGWPVTQSLSPELHNHWLSQQGIDEHYGLLEVAPDDLNNKTSEFTKKLKGWNVTVPHKIEMMALVDDISDTAKAIGAVNTIKVGSDGRLYATNTDVIGFLRNLEARAPNWKKDRPALLLGAGGAARAAAYGLLQAGVPRVYISNRTGAKAEALCVELDGDRLVPLDWADREAVIKDVSLIVNSTTLGMAGAHALELDLSTAQSDTVVYDIVYKPLMTDLIISAEKRGLAIVTGLGMLVHQAVAAFELWFDVTPDLSDGFTEELEDRFR